MFWSFVSIYLWTRIQTIPRPVYVIFMCFECWDYRFDFWIFGIFLAVTTFTDETEALSAVVKNPESFHIAIVEVNTRAENESFKFLEGAKDVLPTISLWTFYKYPFLIFHKSLQYEKFAKMLIILCLYSDFNWSLHHYYNEMHSGKWLRLAFA